MVINYTNQGEVALKTKTETVRLGNELWIGAYHVQGPGEYDIASIHCEGQAVGLSRAYFVRAEDLITMYLTGAETSAAKLDDASDADILVLDVRSDDTAETVKSIIKAIEPAYVFLIGAGFNQELATALSIPTSNEGSLKLSKAGLPLEGTTLILPA